MKAKRKSVGGGAFPSDPSILKKASSKRNLVRGLATLGILWKRGLLPKDLNSHFYITWLAFENGNATRLAKVLNLHRNSLIFIFKNKLRKPSTYKLRKMWLKIGSSFKNKTFSDKVRIFHKKTIGNPRIFAKENRGLVNLWLMGMPRKVVLAHFISWSFRQGLNLEAVSKRLRTSGRSVHRYRSYAAQKGSPTLKWLGSMKVTRSEWFPLWKNWRRKTLRKGIALR